MGGRGQRHGSLRAVGAARRRLPPCRSASIAARSASSRGPLRVVAPLGLPQLPGEQLAVRLRIRLRRRPQRPQVRPSTSRSSSPRMARSAAVARRQERFARARRRREENLMFIRNAPGACAARQPASASGAMRPGSASVCPLDVREHRGERDLRGAMRAEGGAQRVLPAVSWPFHSTERHCTARQSRPSSERRNWSARSAWVTPGVDLGSLGRRQCRRGRRRRRLARRRRSARSRWPVLRSVPRRLDRERDPVVDPAAGPGRSASPVPGRRRAASGR